jgi:hypothetical protein
MDRRGATDQVSPRYGNVIERALLLSDSEP